MNLPGAGSRVSDIMPQAPLFYPKPQAAGINRRKGIMAQSCKPREQCYYMSWLFIFTDTIYRRVFLKSKKPFKNKRFMVSLTHVIFFCNYNPNMLEKAMKKGGFNECRGWVLGPKRFIY
jgi:hypothetical protein